jgi:6-phosphofructokinase 2
MKSFDIVTLTVSPALDKSAHFSGLVPEQKIRCQRLCLMQEEGNQRFKAISRLEGKSGYNDLGIDRRDAKKLLQEESISFE